MVQLIPKLLKLKIEEDSAETKGASGAPIERKLVEVRNENLFGKRLGDSSLADIGGCQVSRVWRNERLEPVNYDDTYEAGSSSCWSATPRRSKSPPS